MSKIEAFTFQGGDGSELAGYRAHPDGAAQAIVQIAHGMGEHFARYERLTQALTAAGYVVYGNDHRGHGRSAKVHGLGDFGPGGFQAVVDDMAALSSVARGEAPQLPLVLLGHSMGSFASQLYLLEHHTRLAGLVLSGTSAMDKLLQGLPAGEGPVSLEAFNAPFEPARTPFDWLSRDEAEVDAYIADHLCGFSLAEGSMNSMFRLSEEARFDPRLKEIRTGLPVYIISGEVDPVVGPGQAFTRGLISAWEDAGLQAIEHRIYPGGRHEMFNETVRDEVTADLMSWLQRIAPGS